MQGVIGVSEDGSYVYFVATGRLSEGASGGGRHNLYVAHEGKVALVAVLGSGDSRDFSERQDLTARVSPNGRWLAFMSDTSLTGYDTGSDRSAASPTRRSTCMTQAPAGWIARRATPPRRARWTAGGLEGTVTEGDGWVASAIPDWTNYAWRRGLSAALSLR